MVKKKIISIVLVISLFLIPFAGMVSLLAFSPTTYHNSFLAGLAIKDQRLRSIEGEKIVVVGGSSVAFGLDSRLLEQSIGVPVVNYGLYASLGSKVMLDLSKSAIGPGDVVVLAFEMDNQTLSMYFNANAMWQAVDCDGGLLWNVSWDDYGKMGGAAFNHVKEKVRFWREGAPDPAGVYNVDSFDEYGDICYDRPENTMSVGFDPNQMIDFNNIVVESAFADYVNEYVDYAHKQGAEVCFSFCPMNGKAIENADADSKAAFVAMLKEQFHCPFISDIDNYIFDASYFFDTNFHLNDEGVFYRTKQLAQDLANHCGFEYTEPVAPEGDENDSVDQPNVPTTPEESPYAAYFEYEDFYGTGWAICGVSEQGKACTALEIPLYHEGKRVLAIMPGAFAQCTALEEITISVGDTEDLILYDGVFAHVDTLRKVTILAKPDKVKVGTESLLQDAAESLQVYVQKKYYAAYVTDYYWATYAEKIQVLTEE